MSFFRAFASMASQKGSVFTVELCLLACNPEKEYNAVAGYVERAIMGPAETVGSGSLRAWFVVMQQVPYPVYVDSDHPLSEPLHRPTNVVHDAERHQAIFYDVARRFSSTCVHIQGLLLL
ncbi:hypothetical protein BCR43DRAFT_489471 [Syncephalastrum racemosum]|uniref:Uncharacterized protein n=1 Tax=Syncephalastrum racemosum TaxID=13706 RepID=A0A1X2HEB6_SYNRA|nr:hypothetical protein BCR43DRAFT_489471 [Syncephalastrum racemosum]